MTALQLGLVARIGSAAACSVLLVAGGPATANAQRPRLDSLPSVGATVAIRVTDPGAALTWGYDGSNARPDTLTTTLTVPAPAAGTSRSVWVCTKDRRCSQLTLHGTGLAAPASRELRSTSGPDAAPLDDAEDAEPVAEAAPGLYANEPSGFGRIAEIAFAARSLPNGVAVRSGYGVRAGCWRRQGWGGPARLVGARAADAPRSPAGVNEYQWPAGLPIGTSAGMLEGWACDADGDGVGSQSFRAVYESGWIKIEGSTLEAPNAGMKLLGYWGVAEARLRKVPNQIYGFVSGGTRSAFNLQICTQNQVARCMGQNANGAPLLVVGQWVRYEILMTLNDVGAADGGLRVWINGQLTHDYHDVVWRTRAAQSGFYGRRWDPIWGGMGQPRAKTRADRMLIDHVYISGLAEGTGAGR
jgi:hypothetical protein